MNETHHIPTLIRRRWRYASLLSIAFPLMITGGAAMGEQSSASSPTTVESSSLSIQMHVVGDQQNNGDITQASESTVLIRVKLLKDDLNETMLLDLNGTSLPAHSMLEAEELAGQRYQQKIVQFINPQGQLLWTMPRVVFGVLMVPLEGALASQLQIPEKQAIVLTEVSPDLPAAEAGFQRHDVIIQCNGQSPMTMDRFSDILTLAEPGQRLNCVVIRGGLEMEIEAELGAYEPGQLASLRAARTESGVAQDWPIPTALTVPKDRPESYDPAMADFLETLHLSPNAPEGSEEILMEVIGWPALRSMDRTDTDLERIRDSVDQINQRIDRIEDILLLMLQQQQTEQNKLIER